MTVSGRWDDTDLVHVVAENLLIEGRPGGPLLSADSGLLEARPDAGLKIDPGMVVKLDGSRIEATVGAQLLVEGLPGQEIVLTSLQDDRYGAGGTFQTNSSDLNALPDEPEPGDWGGIHIGPVARGSIDYAVIAFGGGLTRVEGSFAAFNAVESRQGLLRLTNSLLDHNDDGHGGQAEPSRWTRCQSRGCHLHPGRQPIIVGNIIQNTVGYHTPVISINANSLNGVLVKDYGRSTGFLELITDHADNQGPLVRRNRLANNSLNGMVVRGAVLTTESVWDDTDVVHVLFDQIAIPDVHSYGGLRLESSPTESLVVKFQGNDAGFKATGRPSDYDDRIGGMLHILGQPGHPVV